MALGSSCEKRGIAQWLAVFAIGFGACAGLLGQAGTGAISGTVTDSTGAVLVGAAVQIKNAGTGVSQNTLTDSQGRYTVPDLPIGSYDVQATASGFQTGIHRGITLTVGGQPIVDFALPVGTANQAVTVEGEVTQVNTENSQVGQLVSDTQMRELPLNGRNFEQLLTLAPGVVQIGAGGAGTQSTGNSFYGYENNYSIAGGRPEGQAFLLDNTDIQGFFAHGTGSAALGTSLGIEAIAEFQTLTNTYSAQFGGNGAVVNAATKSGTNSFHGSAYEFLRNSAMDARNFFDGRSVPPFRRNQFGGSVGGPIKKDKMFFFVNYEGLRQSLGQSQIANVPDANAHQGLLPCAAAPTVPCNNGLANVGVSPVMASTLALYPLPTQELGNGIGRVTDVANQVANENYFLARFDYSITSKDSLFMRYVRDTASLLSPFSGSTVPLWPEQDLTANHYATIEERHLFSPALINAARVSFVRPSEVAATTGQTSPIDFFPGREDGQVVVTGLSTIGVNTLLPFGLPENKFTYADDLFWTHGSHSLSAGMSVERIDSNTYAPFLYGGQWTFNSLANFLSGNPNTLVGALPGPTDAYKDFRELFLTPYLNDDWKISSRLTLNLGVRYAFETNPLEVRHKMEAFINPPYGGFQPVTHAFASNPSTKNIDPRIGLAYDPFGDHRTSIRAGFGMFHDLLLPRLYDPGYWLNPPYAIGVQFGPHYPAPFTGQGLLPVQASQVEGMNYYFNATPYMIQYNLNIQHDFGGGNTLMVGYVGSQGVHLVYSVDENPPVPVTGADGRQVFATISPTGTIVPNPRLAGNPLVGALSEKVPYGHSHYNSLLVNFNHSFSHNLVAQASYTYSKSIDDNSVTYGLEGAGQNLTDPYNANFDIGRSNFDHTHSLVSSLVWQVPLARNSRLGGWQASGIFTAISGAPYSIADGFSVTSLGERPLLLPGGTPAPRVTGSPNRWWSPAGFALPPIGELGNLGRNTAAGPGLWDFDFALLKDTRIAETLRLQFRAEFFNIFNHTNFGAPNTGLFTEGPGGAGIISPLFGQIINTATTSRQLQFALKFIF